jgi:hypothetical protein
MPNLNEYDEYEKCGCGELVHTSFLQGCDVCDQVICPTCGFIGLDEEKDVVVFVCVKHKNRSVRKPGGSRH